MAFDYSIFAHKLKTLFEAEHIDVIDDSWKHAGHAGVRNHTGGSHLKITLVSLQFNGLSLLDRHRMVHQALKTEMQTHLHALELSTFTPAEWQNQ